MFFEGGGWVRELVASGDSGFGGDVLRVCWGVVGPGWIRDYGVGTE